MIIMASESYLFYIWNHNFMFNGLRMSALTKKTALLEHRIVQISYNYSIVMVKKEGFCLWEWQNERGQKDESSDKKERIENNVMMWRRWEHVMQSSTWVKKCNKKRSRWGGGVEDRINNKETTSTHAQVYVAASLKKARILQYCMLLTMNFFPNHVVVLIIRVLCWITVYMSFNGRKLIKLL